MFPFLAKRDALEKADAIVVPSGNGFERVNFALSLYKNGYAKKLILAGVTGSRPAKEMAEAAKASGVPESDIMLDLDSHNTKENAVDVLRMAEREHWNKIILVTSPHHQLRAYLTFKKAWSPFQHDVTLINYPPTTYSWLDMIESSRDKDLRVPRVYYFFSEWFRILKYHLKGDL